MRTSIKLNNCFIIFSEYDTDMTVTGFPPDEERTGPEGAEEEEKKQGVTLSNPQQPTNDPEGPQNNPCSEDDADEEDEKCELRLLSKPIILTDVLFR